MPVPIPASQAAELIEALIRHAMHEHSRIQPRGFDSIKARHKIHRELDALFDEHAILLLEAQVEAA